MKDFLKKYGWIIPTCIAVIEAIVIIILAVNGGKGCKLETYEIIFDSDGGSAVTSQNIEKDNKISKPSDPTRDGYTFEGWYLGDTLFDFNTPINSETNLKAKWVAVNAVRYKVTFDSDGGSIIPDQSVAQGNKIAKPADPTRDGYKFMEWQLDNVTYDFDSEVTKDINLKAIWEVITSTVKYKVSFDSKGGNTISAQSIVDGEKASKPSNPIKNGYIFVEWQLNNKKYDFTSAIKSDITLVAVWKEKTKYTVSFNSDGGNQISSKTIYAGDKIGTLETPTRNGFAFMGWYSGTVKYSASSVVNSNLTLKASWLSNDQVNMNAAKEKLVSVDIVKAGQTLNATSTGCTITLTPASSIAQITRGLTDTTINITAAITCGSVSDSKTMKGIIKKSPYTYSATPNSNQLNYDVRVSNSATNYELYDLSDTVMNFPVGEYSSNYGYASVDNGNVSSFPNFKMKFTNDSNTIYIVKKG